MDNLSDDVILLIFSYLPFIDICAAAQVCRSWRRISFDITLRKIIDVRTTPLPVQQIKKLIRVHCTDRLHDLRLRGFIDSYRKPVWRVTTLTPDCLSLLEKVSPHIKCLTMENAFLVKDGKRPSVNLSHFPQSIQHLSLHSSLFHTDLKYISPNLMCLNLGFCTLITSIDLQILSTAPNLRALYLEGCFRVNDGGIDHLMLTLPRLVVLDLEATSISDEGVITLFQNCVSIEELYIGHNKDVTNQAMVTVTIGQMPKLSVLCVVNTEVTSDGYTHLFHQLQSLKTVIFECSSKTNASEQTCAHHLQHKCAVVCYTLARTR